MINFLIIVGAILGIFTFFKDAGKKGTIAVLVSIIPISIFMHYAYKFGDSLSDETKLHLPLILFGGIIGLFLLVSLIDAVIRIVKPKSSHTESKKPLSE